MAHLAPIQDLFHNGVVIFDGAMGTEIYKRNVLTNRCFDELCLSEPGLIHDIHAGYCNAGADVLTTNSFGANRIALTKHGLEDRLADINTRAVEIAHEVAAAANRPVYVAGSVGPITRENRSDEEQVTLYAEHVGALVAAGADFIIFETQPSRETLEWAAGAMKQFPETAFILSCTVFSDCESASGEPIARLMAPLPADWPQPVAWGMNCGTGPDALLTATERAMRVVDRPLVVMPNAGIPREIGERQIYLCSPDYIAGYAKRYLDLGVRGIGGCCGTSPEHIREIAQRIKPLAKAPGAAYEVTVSESVQRQTPAPFAQKSRLAWKLASQKWVATVEIVPPRGHDLAPTIQKARTLYVHNVDAINIPDGPRASSRISPLVTAITIQRDTGIEAILHFCARDRNLIGMQADMLACAAMGVHNILFITGDPPKLGNYPFASGVFDVDAIGMCGVQRNLNEGIDIGGQEIAPKTDAVIGVGADPTALDQDREVRRFFEKVEAGAEFAITQPVFDADALLRFLDKVQDLRIPILAGIWPLANYRNATFLQNEVPGVVIPDDVMERMAKLDNKDDQRRMGIEIAREAVDRMRDRIAGIQVSAPFGNIQTALDVLLD